MTRQVLTWVGKPLAFELRPGLNTLGRNPTNDFRVSDASVSSFHAEISVNEGEIKVRDLNSTNGTFINGLMVEEALVRQNDHLRLGTVELVLEEVTVTVPGNVPPLQTPAPTTVHEMHLCSIHPGLEAAYLCEVCAGFFCGGCVKVVGHDRDATSTVCPSCGGQCDRFRPAQAPKAEPQNMMGRLTQTLKFNLGGKKW